MKCYPSTINFIWVNADDFGLTEGINRGILESARNGILNSVSLMVNAPASADAVSIIEKHPGLFKRIGLHFNLVGNQGCQRPTYRFLTDSKGYYPERWLGLAKLIAQHGRNVLAEIETELRRQIEAMKDIAIQPSHFDSHDHVHCFPGISNIVVRLAKQYDIPYVRCPHETAPLRKSRRFLNIKRLIVGCFAGLSKRKILNAGLTTSNYFYGLTDGGKITKERLTDILNRYNGGVLEIMCHPGFVDLKLQEIFPVKYDWENEVIALTSPGVISLFSRKTVSWNK